MNATSALADDDCYLALKTRDARFDGRFFTGVTSTGIYCRPVCSVKTPKRENCRFFGHAAQAEQAGFRPCLRCRPELLTPTLVALRTALPPEGATAPTARQSRFRGPGWPETAPIDASLALMPLLVASRTALAPDALCRPGSRPADEGITVRLGYRPPYDVAAMLAFIGKRSISTIEFIADSARSVCVTRTFGVEGGGKTHTGWLQASFDEPRCQLVLRVSDSLREVLPLLIHRVRALFDLDADPAAIHSVLGSSFAQGEGLRVPGTLDGFELAVRAVLGQQITVAAARTLAQRLVEKFSAPIETPWPQLTRLFPSPAVLASASGDALGQLGIVRQRQAAITGLARAVADGRLQLQGNADLGATLATLKELPGIGDWTAQYIAMRALRWPDAFLAADVALHKALGLQGLKNPFREAEKASLAWKPWRSYAVLRAWSGLLNARPAIIPANE